MTTCSLTRRERNELAAWLAQVLDPGGLAQRLDGQRWAWQGLPDRWWSAFRSRTSGARLPRPPRPCADCPLVPILARRRVAPPACPLAEPLQEVP